MSQRLFWKSRKHAVPSLCGTALCVALLPGATFAQQPTLPQNSPGQQLPAASAQASLDPSTGLSLLDVLQASLARNPQLSIQQYSVDVQAGALQTARGQFDWVLNGNGTQQRSYAPLSAASAAYYNSPGSGFSGVNSTIANSSAIAFNAAKEYRNGITLSPTLQTTRTTDNINDPNGANQAHTGLQITLPALRNRGRKAVDAQEIYAEKQLKASRMDLSQLVSDTLATAAIRYWNFVAAAATVAVYKASEERALEVLNNSRQLVAADRMPANDLNQARANLASRIASRTGAEQAVLQQRQQLVLVMGLAAEQIMTLPAPSEDIPSSVLSFDPSLLDGYLRLANTGRADVLAARLRVESNAVLTGAARNQLKPQLDITGTAGYTALREGTASLDYARSIVTAPKGVDFTVGLLYNQSPANNAAKGRLVSQLALTRQSEVAASETARNAATTVVVAFQGVRSTITQLQKARESVTYYQAALDGEREKYRLRLNSLVDVLTVEDRLTSVVLDEVNARLAYATALVQLRQATGTIVLAGQDTLQVDPSLFSQLPPAYGTNVPAPLTIPKAGAPTASQPNLVPGAINR